MLSCFRGDVAFLASMLVHGGIRVHRAETLDEADFLLVATTATVLIADTVFLDGSWGSAMTMVASVHPLVGTLLCADPADREFVKDANERGVLDVIWKPIDFERLRTSIRMAHEVTTERRRWQLAREGGAVSGPSQFRVEALR